MAVFSTCPFQIPFANVGLVHGAFPKLLQLFGSAYFSRLGGNSYLSWIWLRSRHFDCDNYSTWYWTSWLISHVSHMNLDPTRQEAHQKKWYSSFDTVFFLASTQLGNWSGTRLQDITRYYQIWGYDITIYHWLVTFDYCVHSVHFVEGLHDTVGRGHLPVFSFSFIVGSRRVDLLCFIVLGVFHVFSCFFIM